MADNTVTDLELQREVEALRTRRRQSVNRVLVDPDLPELHGPGLFPSSRVSMDGRGSLSSLSSLSHPMPHTPPAADESALALEEKRLHERPPLFGSSQRARYRARQREEGSSDAHEKGPLPHTPSGPTTPTDPTHLFWVPAAAHPEISPSDFRTFLKEQAERNVTQLEAESNIPTHAPRSPPLLSPPSSPLSGDDSASDRRVSRSVSHMRRTSSLRKQYRPDGRDGEPSRDPSRSPRPATPSRDISPDTMTIRQLQQLELAGQAQMQAQTDHSARTDAPLPHSPRAPAQLQRSGRNIKHTRPYGAVASGTRGPRARPEWHTEPTSAARPDMRSFSPSMVSTIEALALDSMPSPSAREDPFVSTTAAPDARPEPPRRGNTLPSRLDPEEEAHQQRTTRLAEVRAKASSKDILPELPTATASPQRRSLERVPVPTLEKGLASPPPARPLPAPGVRPDVPMPPHRPDGSRPLPEPKPSPNTGRVHDGRQLPQQDHARPVPPVPREPARPAPEVPRPIPPIPEPKTALEPRADAPLPTPVAPDSALKPSRDKRSGFGLSWFGHAKEEEERDAAALKRREKDERRKAKDEPPPPPPLLGPTAAPVTKRREKEGFLGSLFGKRKGQEPAQDSLRHRAKTLFTGTGPQPPAVVDNFPYTRYPLHVERALYRLSHLKLANPRRALQDQVVISNLMFWYLSIVNGAPSGPAATNHGDRRQGGRSEYDPAERRACAGTPPVPVHTGTFSRPAQAYLPPMDARGMMHTPAWPFVPPYPGMYFDPHTQSWAGAGLGPSGPMPMPAPMGVSPAAGPGGVPASAPASIAASPSNGSEEYDVGEYVLDGYYAGSSGGVPPGAPRADPPPSAHAPSWSARSHRVPAPLVPHDPNATPPLPEKQARSGAMAGMPRHAPGPTWEKAPAPVQRRRSGPRPPLPRPAGERELSAARRPSVPPQGARAGPPPRSYPRS